MKKKKRHLVKHFQRPLPLSDVVPLSKLQTKLLEVWGVLMKLLLLVNKNQSKSAIFHNFRFIKEA